MTIALAFRAGGECCKNQSAQEVTVPGDNQTSELVATWVRKYVSDGTVMVARHQQNDSTESSLVAVDYVISTSTYLRVKGLGTFQPNGLKTLLGGGPARILIPLPNVVQWATGDHL